ncbi:unnamed protein product [Pieris brassicae]|uniref:Uncharacterized protein n=1 Tax=Pieris brassicae TaxID=7116 RepID=A0A9P0T7Y7_PIEBR|nr:unnamed protein product [Pieris brassicae]
MMKQGDCHVYFQMWPCVTIKEKFPNHFRKSLAMGKEYQYFYVDATSVLIKNQMQVKNGCDTTPQGGEAPGSSTSLTFDAVALC